MAMKLNLILAIKEKLLWVLNATNEITMWILKKLKLCLEYITELLSKSFPNNSEIIMSSYLITEYQRTKNIY